MTRSFSSGSDRALHKRKILGPIGPSRRSLIAQQHGLRPQQDEIEIVIVIVVDPYGGFEAPGGKFRRLPDEFAARVSIQHRTGRRQHAEIHVTVVVEVARKRRRSHRSAPSRPVSAAGMLPLEEQTDSLRRPHEKIGLAAAGGVD